MSSNKSDDDEPLSKEIASEDDGKFESELAISSEIKPKKKKKIHKLSLEETEDFNAKLRKRGVVYISRIPPRMGPSKVKALLGEFGVVTRIYLEEEDKSVRKRRQKASGSSGGKRYTEGWVEYEDKRVAKRVATALNNTPITNHKRNVHFGDLWNLKYLSKFQWAHLTEKVAYERRVREQRLKIEMMKAKKENQAYSTLVEAGKTMDRIEARRRKREAREGPDKSDSARTSGIKKARKFRQNKPDDDRSDKAANAAVLKSLV